MNKRINYYIIVLVLSFLSFLSVYFLTVKPKPVTVSETELTSKPSYEYLKSVTVYINGCAKEAPKDIGYLIDKEGVCWLGTGIIVKTTTTDTYVLTNKHVAGGDTTNPILYVEEDNQKIEAEIIKYHDYLDLAVLKIPRILRNKSVIKGFGYPTIQDEVFIVGHPLGNKYIYTEGIVAGYVDMSLLLQAPCIFGNSGSGVFDKDGKLVGLVYALQGYSGFLGMPMAQITHTLCVDIISIDIFLEKLGITYE